MISAQDEYPKRKREIVPSRYASRPSKLGRQKVGYTNPWLALGRGLPERRSWLVPLTSMVPPYLSSSTRKISPRPRVWADYRPPPDELKMKNTEPPTPLDDSSLANALSLPLLPLPYLEASSMAYGRAHRLVWSGPWQLKKSAWQARVSPGEMIDVRI